MVLEERCNTIYNREIFETGYIYNDNNWDMTFNSSWNTSWYNENDYYVNC